jgi:dihydrofolate reductase
MNINKFKPKIILIAAMDNAGAIGRDNDLPWRCPEDMRHFISLTTNKVVLMGRKTAESLPKPLKNRVNLILTRDIKYKRDGFITVNNMVDIKKILIDSGNAELWVIGGGEIYNKFISTADILHLSIIDTIVDNPDTFFPINKLSLFNTRYVTPCADPMINFWVLTRHKTSKREYRNKGGE